MPNILHSTKHREQWACLHTANAIVNLLGLVALKNNFSFSLLVWKSSRLSSSWLGTALVAAGMHKIHAGFSEDLGACPQNKVVVLRLSLFIYESSRASCRQERFSWNEATAVTHGSRVQQALSSWRCSKSLMLYCQSLIIINNSVITILITWEAEVHWWFLGSF